VTDPVACEPTVWAATVVGGPQVTVNVPLAPTVPTVNAWGGVDTPLSCMKHPVVATLEVPELVRTSVHTLVAPTHEVTCALTCAELVNEPNRPNTNPAMAMAAMRVMAMRMTVASTGEMAFLFFL